jgi:hypothetical protein
MTTFEDWSKAIAQYGQTIRQAAQAAQRPPVAPAQNTDSSFFPPLAYQDSAPVPDSVFRGHVINPSSFDLANHADWGKFEREARPSQNVETSQFYRPPSPPPPQAPQYRTVGPQASPDIPYLQPGNTMPGFGSQ